MMALTGTGPSGSVENHLTVALRTRASGLIGKPVKITKSNEFNGVFASAKRSPLSLDGKKVVKQKDKSLQSFLRV
jgi:hypothetical protein